MGAAVGDLNNDGFADFVVTNSGSIRLWINNGDGTFDDVAEDAGCALSGFATAASCCDYDRDGHLDLFVVNYVDYLAGRWCEDAAGRQEFCGGAAVARLSGKKHRPCSSAFGSPKRRRGESRHEHCRALPFTVRIHCSRRQHLPPGVATSASWSSVSAT